MKLQVAAGQRTLVATVERSLAQVAYEPAGRALAMFDGDEAVGMMLLYDGRMHPQTPVEQLFVWRLMVDARHQGRGIGRRAIAWILDEARRMGLPAVGLSHAQDAGHAGPFYEKLGFRYTGELDGDELMMVHPLDSTR
ncbi:MAG: GNAT family N-acetyltransferase [Rubrivivax sp.]|nr:GNAT family N-acetyltransferase [Rubrivivax sp.]